MLCHSCDAVYARWGKIEGIVHETGCPDAWKDEVRSCLGCGCEFKPEEKGQEFCGEDCFNLYYNL